MNTREASSDSWPLSSRGWLVWGAAVVTWGLLLFSCRHLAVLAEGEWEPFQPTLIDEVPLAAKCEVLEQYLALMRARFGERLRVDVAVDRRAEQALVPSMILQPPVENAIRHGNVALNGAGAIEVRARRAFAGYAGSSDLVRLRGPRYTRPVHQSEAYQVCG